VGKGVSNTNHGDVLLVQRLLNRHRGTLPPIGEDGVVGPETIGAIEEFQKRAVGMSWPDGRVDPGGKTIRALSEPGSGPAPVPPPLAPPVGTIRVNFRHRGAKPTGVTGLPGATDKTTNTRYESAVTVTGGGLSGSFRGSIYPDNMNVKGRIKDGTYDIWLGFHKDGSPKQEDLVVKTNGCRAALVVNNNGTVPVISNSPTKQTASYIHVHNGFNTWVASTPMSEGCQILHPADWAAFIKLFINAFPNIGDWVTGTSRVGKKIGSLVVGG
jgi:peptidoglycan hydrolase-like protein with peptidoglycan-binding domain